MRERAGSSRGTLTQLLTDITSDTPIEVRAELGNPETIKRSLRREHAKHLPKNPNSVGDLVFIFVFELIFFYSCEGIMSWGDFVLRGLCPEGILSEGIMS